MANEFQKIEQSMTDQAADLEAVFQAQESQLAAQETAQQAEVSETLQNIFEEGSTNPLQGRIKDQKKTTLEENQERIRKAEKVEKSIFTKRLASEDDIRDSSQKFQKRNPELKEQILKLLLDKVKDCRSKEDLQKIVSQFYQDPTTADDAYDFLLETTRGDLNEIARGAKESHNTEFGRQIAAGRNIQAEVMKSDPRLGAPKTLRDLYREITGTPRDPVSLFIELSDRYNYKDLRKVLSFLFHSLGADLKSAGPSIAPGMLYRLLSEVRSLQAILGVYSFFKQRMNLIGGLFQKNGLESPKQLTFEQISRQFVGLLQERYPTGDKVLQTAGKLGIEKWILAKIIIFSQLRDAIREVALNQLYRSIDHRNELYQAILEALESLEEELDALMEEDDEDAQEEDPRKKKKKKGAIEELEEKDKT